VLSAVETRMPQKLRDRISAGFRYIDDFFLYCDTLADAEAVLSGLREATLQFDLQLNAAKTQTIPALVFNEESWPSEISAMRIAPTGRSQRRSLIRFFSAVIRIAKELPDESIASFAVRRTAKVPVDEENWDLYEAFLVRIARENSNCIDSVVKILCTYAAIGYTISPSVRFFVERVIADHAPYNQHFEVAWALWLARSLEIRLSPRASSLILRMENDICVMLALHLRGRRLLPGGSQISSWLGPVTAADLRGEHWLLIYEAASRKGWPIDGAASAVAGDDFFKAMKDEKSHSTTVKHTTARLTFPALNGRSAPRCEIRSVLSFLVRSWRFVAHAETNMTMRNSVATMVTKPKNLDTSLVVMMMGKNCNSDFPASHRLNVRSREPKDRS
jgi:hypothetical protein